MSPNLIHTFYPEKIPATISAFRPDGEVPVLNERYIDGGECRIFKVDFSDGESWSVRIPIHVQSDSQDAILSVLGGINLRIVISKGSARIHSYSQHQIRCYDLSRALPQVHQ